MTIDFSDEQIAALQVKAAAQGLTLEDWLRKLATEEAEPGQPLKPFKSGYGMLAKYDPAPSPEDIEENRREMLRVSPANRAQTTVRYTVVHEDGSL